MLSCLSISANAQELNQEGAEQATGDYVSNTINGAYDRADINITKYIRSKKMIHKK